MFTGHQVQRFQVQFNANSFSGHLNGTAWSWARWIVQINTHFELVLNWNRKETKIERNISYVIWTVVSTPPSAMNKWRIMRMTDDIYYRLVHWHVTCGPERIFINKSWKLIDNLLIAIHLERMEHMSTGNYNRIPSIASKVHMNTGTRLHDCLFSTNYSW